MPEEEIYLEQAIRTHLLNDAVLASYLGDDAVYFSTLPNDAALPAIVIQEISAVDPSPTHSGHSGIENRRFQFTIFSDCVHKRVRIKTRLDRYLNNRNVVVGQAAGSDGVWCPRISKANQTDLGLDPGRRLFMYAMDFIFTEKVQP